MCSRGRKGEGGRPMLSYVIHCLLSVFSLCEWLTRCISGAAGAAQLWVMVLLRWLQRHLISLQLPHNAVSLPQHCIPSCQHLKASGSWGFSFLHELPVPSSFSRSAMKRSKLLFKQVWPCAFLSSGQLFRRHLMLNMELLTEMSYSLLGSWQTAGESQEEQKRFIRRKVFYYRQGEK